MCDSGRFAVAALRALNTDGSSALRYHCLGANAVTQRRRLGLFHRVVFRERAESVV